MTRIFLISILVFCLKNINAQESDSSDFEVDPNDRSFKKGWLSDHDSWDIQYGVFNSDFKKLNSNFKDKYNETFKDNINLIGISKKETFYVNRKFLFDGHFTCQFVQPMKIYFSDSLTFKLNGFHLGFDLEKDLFPKSDFFDLLFGLGFNTGRLKLLRKDLAIENNFLKYTNPFFSPTLLIEPKINFGNLSISVKAQYLFDISNSNWNIKDSKLPSIGTYKSTGLIIQGSIGFNF